MSHIYLCLSNSSIVMYVTNTESEVIPEAAQASVYPCQVPHYIYLSAIAQTQAQFILTTLSASTIFSFNFIHKIQITNCLYLSATSLTSTSSIPFSFFALFIPMLPIFIKLKLKNPTFRSNCLFPQLFAKIR